MLDPATPKLQETLKEAYFGICDEGPRSCLYGCLTTRRAHSCAACMAAQLKAELDGRNCGICDCCCVGFPYNQVAVRRQLRTKYNLEMDLSDRPCGVVTIPISKGCRGTYFQDCWMVFCFGAFVEVLVATFCSNWSKSAANCLHTLMLCQSTRELRRREQSYGDMTSDSMCYGRLVTSSRFGAAVNQTGRYAHNLFGCLSPFPTCLYTFLCFCCAMGESTAMTQGRRCDCLDVVSFFSAYELRKTVKAKYGIIQPWDSYFGGQLLEPFFSAFAECLKEREEDIADGCCCILCFCCMVNQDYKELQHRALEDIIPSVSISSYGTHDTIPPNNAEKKPLVESMER